MSEISQYIDRSKSNAMIYLNNLENRNLIQVAPKNELPSEIMQKRGPKKYYQLTHLGNIIFDTVLPQLMDIPFIDQIDEQLELDSEDFIMEKIKEIQQYIKEQQSDEVNPFVIRSYMIAQINVLMEQISYLEYQDRLDQMSQLVIDNLDKLMNQSSKKDSLSLIMEEIPPSLQLSNLYHIPVHSLDQAKELSSIIINFFRELEAFKQKAETKTEDVRGYQHLYLFTGFLNGSLFHDSNRGSD